VKEEEEEDSCTILRAGVDIADVEVAGDYLTI
jgi:hypothetical protein